DADALLREALQQQEATGDPDRTDVLTHLCFTSYQLGRYADARRWGIDAVAFADACNNPFYKGLALCFLHMVALATHDDAAAPLLAEALAHWRANRPPRGGGAGLVVAAGVLLVEGGAR